MLDGVTTFGQVLEESKPQTPVGFRKSNFSRNNKYIYPREIPFKAAKYFQNEYGVSPASLRKWATSGQLEHIRTPGGKRMYNVSGVTRILGIDTGNMSKSGYIYARVSSSKQAADLERQIEDLQKAYPRHKLIKDIGSGVNFKRKGLCTLLDCAIHGLVSEVVVMHRDRLARLGFDLLEFLFAKVGTKIVVHGKHDEGEEHERDLADDLFAVTTLFVASHNGRRAAANRKRRREETKSSREGESASRGEKGVRTSDEKNEDD